MALGDYNTNPDLNVTIGGINISEGCPAENINDAIRELMADLASAGTTDTSGLMPKVAGAFSGTQPKYTGRGAYLHHNNSAFASGRVFVQAAGGSQPAGMVPGDLLLEY